MGMTHKQKQGLIQESKNHHFNLLYNKNIINLVTCRKNMGLLESKRGE